MLGEWTRIREAFGLEPFTVPPDCLDTGARQLCLAT